MVSQAWIDAQPKTYDYLRVNAYRLVIHPLPKVSYFAQKANLPGISLGVAKQSTPLHDLPIAGDKLEYGQFSLTFMVSEDMENWAELYSWIQGLGFPDTHEQFLELRQSGQMKRLSTSISPFNEESGIYADATLFLLDAANNTKLSFNFVDLFPVALSDMEMDSGVDEMSYLKCTATFLYKGLSVDIP
jgi:hypothetical protein